jgi:hypothetical protein
MQHILASRRLIMSQGAVSDVEKTRAEWARPDGVVVTNRPVSEGVKADDQSFDFAGWTKMLELNLAEIENFGPNPALIGQGIENKSGRAIHCCSRPAWPSLARTSSPTAAGRCGFIARCGAPCAALEGGALDARHRRRRVDAIHPDQRAWASIRRPASPTIVNAIGSLDVDIISTRRPTP